MPSIAAEPRRQPVVAAVDRRRLRPRARRPPAPRRRHRRPVRTPRRADRRHRASSASGRCCSAFVDSAGPLIGLACAHRPRRRAPHARHAVDHHQRVPARGAGQGGRHLGRLRRRRRHPRHPRVGRAARAVLVGLDLPRHRGARGAVVHRRDRWWCRAPSPRSTSASTRAARCSRRSASASSCSASSKGPSAGWTNPLTLVGLIGGVVVPRRVHLAGAAHRRAAARPAPVQAPRLRHRIGVAVPAVLRHVRLLLRVAAVPAARARLQHVRSRARRCCR